VFDLDLKWKLRFDSMSVILSESKWVFVLKTG
jgi:hypothetical protein